ncbi:hypothetical protein M501DRAFT_931817 [Patellaria atrata CBS 101060]|uniref:Helix-turn-helix domain-containing protein n=1 Tax=Patellaria atrata CBS 101060 TaxID=1346257 RepID=A0A9P4SDD2_9PEZI|nr:hypothetical protein M501DRAFT_931817 [Patellaria atrata CBS 101060]
MGSSASKATKTAASATRKYPSRISTATQTQPQRSTNAPPQPPSTGDPTSPGPTTRPQVQASSQKDEAISLDASDPVYASHLRQLGAVQPNPHFSHSSTSPLDPTPSNAIRPSFSRLPIAQNPALVVLEARRWLQAEAEKEFEGVGRRGFKGRRFVDAVTIRQALRLREEGVEESRIEKSLGLENGVVGKLGRQGVLDSS